MSSDFETLIYLANHGIIQYFIGYSWRMRYGLLTGLQSRE